jgi:succinate dehydrogenase / fumarate reductase membrane anchor subunit
VLGLGTAGGAGEHWWTQRLTAVALVPLGLWFASSLALLPDFAYATVVQWAQRPVTSILLLLTVLTVGYHSYLGLQVVIEDYVHGKGRTVLALIGSAFGHAALAIPALFAILRIAFGPVA